IDSTSRPTYPTSVNFDASTFMNGALASFDSLLAISVLPTPVGPIMMMFLGRTSSLRSGASLCLRHLFLNAIATAFFALSCPIINLFSSSTIFLGVRVSMLCQLLDEYVFVRIDADARRDLHRLFQYLLCFK